MNEKERSYETYVIPARFYQCHPRKFLSGICFFRFPLKACGNDSISEIGNDSTSEKGLTPLEMKLLRSHRHNVSSWKTLTPVIWPAHRKRSLTGLTLLELVLSLTILSFVLLASSSLALSASRLSDLATEDLRLQNHVWYVIRTIETDLRFMSKIDSTQPSCDAQSQDCVLMVTGKDSTDRAVTIQYNYSRSTMTLSRTSTIGGLSPPPTILSSGILIPMKVNNLAIPIFNNLRDRLVEVNLAAEITKHETAVRFPGVSEKILLRGVVNP